MPWPVSKKPAGLCYFLANTSRVDFDDLVVVNEQNPAVEGFFDKLYDIDDYREILKEKSSSGGNLFTPEAEWILVFKDPIAPKDEPAERNLGKRMAAFTGIIEGKWLEDLKVVEPNNWLDASKGNNFYKKEELYFLPIEKWDEILTGKHSKILEYLDKNARVTVAYCNSQDPPERKTRTAWFKIMRKELFGSKPGGDSPLTDLVSKVLKIYEDDVFDQFRGSNHLKGVNFGAHGDEAGLVLEKRRQRRAAVESFPKIINGVKRFPVECKKAVAEKIIEEKEFADIDGCMSIETFVFDCAGEKVLPMSFFEKGQFP